MDYYDDDDLTTLAAALTGAARTAPAHA